MLRKSSPAAGRRAFICSRYARSLLAGARIAAGKPVSRFSDGMMTSVAALFAFAVTGGVSAESLAQPRDNALERKAAEYIEFREDIAAIEAIPFNSAEITREAHRRLSAHDASDLSSGWVAYAALVAADTPAFKQSLQKEVKDGKKGRKKLSGPDAFFAKLAQDPGYPRTLPGADEAVKRVLDMTTKDSARVIALGEAFKSQAYAMQKTSWGKAKIPSGSVRLSDADAFARTRPAVAAPVLAAVTEKGVTAPSLASADTAWDPNWGTQSASGRMTEPNAQVIMNRVLNLAARYAVSGVNETTVSVYAKNDKSSQCLIMASLTLKQCIAATRTPYEEAFCLGAHALNDVAGCVGWVAGVDADQGS